MSDTPKKKPILVSPRLHKLIKARALDEDDTIEGVAEDKLWELFPAEKREQEVVA